MDAIAERLERAVAWLANVLGLVIFAALTGLFFAVIASRVVPGIGATLTSADELIRFFFIWLVFLGAVVALHRGEHIRITFVMDALPPRVRAVMAILANLISIGFLYVMVTAGLSLVQLTTNQRSVGLGIPMHLVHAVIPISGAAMLLFVLLSLIRNLGLLLGRSAHIPEDTAMERKGEEEPEAYQ